MTKKFTVVPGDKLGGAALAQTDDASMQRAVTLRLQRKIHDLGCSFEPSTGTFHGRRGVYTVEDLAECAWLELTDCPLSAFKVSAKELSRELRMDAVNRIKGAVLDGGEGREQEGVKELTKFVNLLTHPNSTDEQRKYYLVAWRQLIWQVKRRLRGLDTSWEMMLCLYSKQGTGKSSVVAKFGRPLRQLYMPMADFTLFSDKFRLPQLHTHYLVCLDEMGRAKRTDINTIKQIITAETVQSRKIYSQAEICLTRNASFIATTNRPLMASLTDSTGMRRFVEMRCSDAEVTDEWIAAINALDFSLMWACESGDAETTPPAADHRELFAKYQNASATRSDFDYWAEQCLTVTDAESDKIKNGEAYAAYREHCRSQDHKPISIQLFAREMKERYGVSKVHNAVYFSGLRLAQRSE